MDHIVIYAYFYAFIYVQRYEKLSLTKKMYSIYLLPLHEYIDFLKRLHQVIEQRENYFSIDIDSIIASLYPYFSLFNVDVILHA